MSKSLAELRAQYSRFTYQEYFSRIVPEGLELSWTFEIHSSLPERESLIFRPRVLIQKVDTQHLAALSQEELDTYVFTLGLVEMLSYWKTTCAPEIVVAAGHLSSAQIAWWHNLLIQGMGEFFFVNQIDFTPANFVTISTTGPEIKIFSTPASPQSSSHSHKILVPLGGGKDSVVTLELLRQLSYQENSNVTLGCLLINPTGAAQTIADASGVPETLSIQRTIDPQLKTLNTEGFLNGHTPFSSLVAFLSVLTARLFGYDLVAVSNERSSNEGNVVFHGHEINHQYSKTYEFESALQEYVRTYLAEPTGAAGTKTVPPLYFSFMRPLFELQIGKLFAQFTEYHQIFRSCNRGQKLNIWCGECPKCLFAYALLYPFLSHQEMVKIFGSDLFAKPHLLPLALELLGYAEKKPLECVGTHEENRAAFYLSAQKILSIGLPLPALLRLVQEQVLSHEADLDTRASTVLNSWNNEHSIPEFLVPVLKKQLAIVNG